MDTSTVFDTRIFGFFGQALRGQAGSRRFFRLLEAALFQRFQAGKRRRAAKAGLVVPPILIASVTRRCNLDCKGCYAKALRPGTGSELGDARFMELFREALELGVGTILLAGGEPLLRRDLVVAAAGLKGVLLPLFTNGTLIDEDFLDLAATSSLVPVLSIEGEEGDTDDRRGAGIHDRVSSVMAAMRERGIVYGASITLTSRNADRVLSPGFLEGLRKRGISLLFLIEYVPAQPGTRGLVLSQAQKAALDARPGFAGLPFPVVILPGDEASYGGCLAAGRGFIHLSESGRLEACPFAPFSDSEAGSTSLREALDSPLMRAIRERHGELSENSGGCALWDKAGWVSSLGACVRSEGRPAPVQAEDSVIEEAKASVG